MTRLQAIKYEGRSLLEFQKAFTNDEDCAKHLMIQRWENDFICPKCGNKEFWYLTTRKLYECRNCHLQTSATAGTIFHKTRVPLLKWYWLIYHMAMKWSPSQGQFSPKLRCASFCLLTELFMLPFGQLPLPDTPQQVFSLRTTDVVVQSCKT